MRLIENQSSIFGGQVCHDRISGGSVIESLKAVGVVQAPDAQVFLVDPSDETFTLQDAIDACIDEQGDVILCLPGTHNIAGAVEFNKRYITVVSSWFGGPYDIQGENFMIRPKAGTVDTYGAIVTEPCRVIGMGFSTRDLTKGGVLIDCEEQGGDKGGFTLFDKCRFSAWYGAQDHAVKLVGGAQNHFRNCTFDGLFSGFATAGIRAYNDGAFAPVYLHVLDCEFHNLGSSKPAIKHESGSLPLGCVYGRNVLCAGFGGNHGILLDNGNVVSTGVAFDNICAGLAAKANAFTNLGASTMKFVNNHYEEA